MSVIVVGCGFLLAVLVSIVFEETTVSRLVKGRLNMQSLDTW